MDKIRKHFGQQIGHIEFCKEAYVLFALSIETGTSPVSKLPVKYLNKININHRKKALFMVSYLQ
jgi:hypothetical protein